MIRQFVERTLGKVFAVHAKDPDPSRMTRTQLREAQEVNQPSGKGQKDDFADHSRTAAHEARSTNESEIAMEDDYADASGAARTQSRAASEPDGSYLESPLSDDDDAAAREAELANPHEPPRDDLAEDNETAREDVRRANRPPEEGGNAWQRRKKWPV